MMNQTGIAQKLGVDKSTVSRELKRNVGLRNWRPKQADKKARARKDDNQNAVKFGACDWKVVDGYLREDWSPEQIAGRLRLEGTMHIVHETIYRHVYDDKETGGDLCKHLRCQKQQRKRYASGQNRRGVMKNRVSIDERPEIVDLRERLGDWEGDTVVGKNHKGAMVTLADRVSRYTLAQILQSKESIPVTQSVTDLLTPHKSNLHSITFDNGTEFSGHETIASNLEANVYFAHPYHSWERGLNENTNGLLRQYFPKGTDFTLVTQPQVDYAVEHLNGRPRKILGFKKPNEVHFATSR